MKTNLKIALTTQTSAIITSCDPHNSSKIILQKNKTKIWLYRAYCDAMSTRSHLGLLGSWLKEHVLQLTRSINGNITKSINCKITD